MRKSLSALVVLAIATLSPVLASPSAASCRPAFLKLFKAAHPDASNWFGKVGFNAALIGCEKDLKQLSDADIRAAREMIKKLGAKDPARLERLSKDHAYTRGIARKVNAKLGRSIVTDVMFFDFVYKEE